MLYDKTQSTVLSILRGANDAEPSVRNLALEKFCESYRPPLVEFLCHSKRLQMDEAEDVVQSFLLSRIVQPPSGKDLISKYLDKRAKHSNLSFRQYLARSLVNHLITLRRRSQSETQVGPLLHREPSYTSSDSEFDAVWANHIFGRALRMVRDECLLQNQEQIWNLLVAHVLRPAQCGEKSPGYARLAKELSFASPKAAANAMQTMLRKLRRAMRISISDYLPTPIHDDDDRCVATEIDSLFEILSAPGILLLDDSLWETKTGKSTDSRVAHQGSAALQDRLDRSQLFCVDGDLSLAWAQLLDAPISDWLLEDSTQREAGQFTLRQLLCQNSNADSIWLGIRDAAKREGKKGTDAWLPSEFFAVTYLLATIALNKHTWGEPATSVQAAHQVKIQRQAKRASELAWLDKETLQWLTRIGNPLEEQ